MYFVCLLICLPKSTDRPFCLNNKHFSHLRGRNGRWPIWDYRGIACCSQGGRVCSEHLPFQLRSRPLAPHWSQQLSFVQPGSKKKRDPKSKTWMWAICWSGKTFLPLHQLPILRSHISILKRPSDAWWPWAWAVILLLAHSIFLATSIASSYLHLLKRIICYWCLLGASARCNGATFA